MRCRRFNLLWISLAIFVSTAELRAAECDLALGKRVFSQCAACHSLTPGQHLTGPSLAGLKGRRAGSVAGFNFSDALRASGWEWGEPKLDLFLKNPQSALPGTVMPFGGIRNDSQRTALICYLLQ